MFFQEYWIASVTDLVNQLAVEGDLMPLGYEILTGLLYTDKDSADLHHILDTSEEPLNNLQQEDLCPGEELLENISASLR